MLKSGFDVLKSALFESMEHFYCSIQGTHSNIVGSAHFKDENTWPISKI